MAPVDERDAQRLAQQQRAKARAVDEQAALDAAFAIEGERDDVAGLTITLDRADLALDPRDAAFLGIAAQHGGEGGRIEMIGVGQVGNGLGAAVALCHAAGTRGGDVDAVIVIVAGDAHRPAAQPQLPERDQPDAAPDGAETVDVTVPDAEPVDELNPQLETAVGGAEEFGLVDAEPDEEIMDLRDRRLADADGADLVRFDQRDRGAIAEEAGEGRGRHPASSAPAGDHDIEGREIGHRAALHGIGPRRNCAPGAMGNQNL